MLTEIAGERYAKNFLRWREVETLDVPLVMLIGGATGVGKSTIATQLAARLGIVRFVATDAIREVMRSMFSPELMPTLYTSSFEADAALREPPTRLADPLIVGFREQTAAVAVGINALIERAAVEGTSIVIEGAHVVPGFFDLDAFAGGSSRSRSCSRSTTRSGTARTSARAEDSVASRPAQRYAEGIREHPSTAGVREEPGALARGAHHPQLQLRPVDRRGDRSGHGTRDRAGRGGHVGPRTPRRTRQ